jgi:hypothetical protein
MPPARTWQQGPERADHVHGATAGDQIVLANGIAGHNLDEPADALERPLGDHHADDRPGGIPVTQTTPALFDACASSGR